MPWLSATKRITWASVVSDAILVELASIRPFPLMVPAKTAEPGSLVTGRLSPVIGAWFTSVVPWVTVPSKPIRSPGGIRKIVPTGTCAAGVVWLVPSGSTTLTDSGAIFISASTALRARPTLQDSNAKERANKKLTVAASNHCPIPIAPSTAIVISRFMSGRNRRSEYQAFGSTNQAPDSTAPM